MNAIEGNAIVFTQGGPTAVINASWVGVVQGLMDADEITGVWGSMNGIDGPTGSGKGPYNSQGSLPVVL